MYLVDTNIWLERLLGQARSQEVGDFLNAVPSESLFVTDFSFHSLGLILCRLNHEKTLQSFVEDILINGAVGLVHLLPEDTQKLIEVRRRWALDYDDAYQYVATEKYSLTLVSFDSDFDKTTLGRVVPADVIQLLKASSSDHT